MMSEIVSFFQDFWTIFTPVLAVGGILAGTYKWHKNKVDEAFKKGKQEETCLTRIENKADDAVTKIEGIGAVLDGELKRANDIHKIMFERINKVDQDVSYIKGKIDILVSK